MEQIKNFCRNESGASSVEYGLLIAFIAMVIIGAVTSLGESVKDKLNEAAVRLGGTAG